MAKSQSNGKKKILLIEPKSPGLHLFSIYPLPRLGTVLLGTMLKEKGYDVQVLFEALAPLRAEQFRDAAVVGISTTGSTARRGFAIADWAREQGIPVVMGGPHVSFLPHEALEHADYAVMGEGETIFPPLVDALCNGQDIPDLPGLLSRESFKDVDAENLKSLGCGYTDEAMPALIDDLDSLPIPDLNLIQGEFRWKNITKKRLIPVQAGRGCPFRCTFCTVTKLFGHRIRNRSISRIMEEVMQYNTENHQIFFYDDNLAADRDWLKSLLTEFINKQAKFSWTTQVRIDAAKDEELLALMKASKCKTLYVGIESANPESLQHMNKRQTRQEITDALRSFARHDIPIHGMFVIGFDTDTVESIDDTVTFAKEMDVNTAQFMILTPSPGTEAYEQMRQEGRILFEDWALYDGHHVTYRPARMTPLQLQEAQIKAHAKFYDTLGMIKRAQMSRLEAAAVFPYARTLNWRWRYHNRLYMKALRLMSKSKGVIRSVDYQTTPQEPIVIS